MTWNDYGARSATCTASKGGRRYVAVLGVPPIKSAQDAVRASIAADTRRR